MLLYRDNRIDGEFKMSVEAIAASFIENGNLDYKHMEYAGLYHVIISYISNELGTWDTDLNDDALSQLDEIYDLVKAELKEKKLGLWGVS